MYIPYNAFVTDAVTFCEINVFMELTITCLTSGPTPQVASSAVHMSAQANKERKRGEKRKKKKKREHRAGFELGLSASQTVSLTTRPCEHPRPMATFPPLLREKTGELSYDYFVKL